MSPSSRDLDPNYAALGGSHFEAVVSGWKEFRQEELEQAEALAQKALALDPTTTCAYRLLALINLYKRRHDLPARVDRPRARDQPARCRWFLCARKHFGAGRATEALPWLERALRFDHGHLLTANSLCWAYYFLGRYTFTRS